MMRSHFYISLLLIVLLNACVKQNNKAYEDDLKTYDPRVTSDIIYFISNANGDKDIYSIKSDGSNLVNISNSPNINETQIIISHNQKKMAYIADGAVYSNDLDFSGAKNVTTQLVFGTSLYTADYIGWSSKSNFLAVVDLNQEKMYYLDVFTGSLIKENFVSDFQTTNNNLVYDPSFNWRTNILAYIRLQINGNDSTYTLEISEHDGYHNNISPPQVLHTSTEHLAGPRFNYADDQIVFIDNDEVSVIQTDGSGLQQITSNNGICRSPMYSPDDSLIVFSSYLTSSYDIMTINVDGTGAKKLTTTDGFDETRPFWD